MKRIAIICVAMAALSAVPARAHADRRALVLPTVLDGFVLFGDSVRKATKARIEGRLLHVPVAVSPDPLTGEESLCADEPCLSALAEHHGVDIAIATRITNDEKGKTGYHVTVHMFVRDEEPHFRQRETPCPSCTDDAASELAASEVKDVLENRPSEPPPTPAVTAPAPSPPAKWPANLSRKQKIGYRVAGLILLALGVGGVSQGFVEVAHNNEQVGPNGETGCAPNCGFHRDTTKGQALFFSLGGASLVVGVVLTTAGFWPTWRSAARARIWRRRASPARAARRRRRCARAGSAWAATPASTAAPRPSAT
jgi:hypothetical protein